MHNAKGSIWLVAVLSLLFFSACTHTDRQRVDELNSLSYAYHYRDIDSTEAYARRAYELAVDYGDGRAEALNNLAFASILRMHYDKAALYLDEAIGCTDNCVELLISAVQQMRLCQRMSRNREFYDYREKAIKLINRINEERGMLDGRLRRRMVYAETEYAIVASTYYYYVGLERQSREALAAIEEDGEIRNDTAQYLNYLYNKGAGGIVVGQSQEGVATQEFELLLECFFTAQQRHYIFFEANALQALAEHLLSPAVNNRLMADYGQALNYIVPRQAANRDAYMLAGSMADASLALFESFGDVYQTAGAHRTLASCYTAVNDYGTALSHLEQSLADTTINRAPDLVASIREQLSVAYSAIDNKPASDYNRNIYLDMQEQTRQDRSLEARADRLSQASLQLNIMIAAVVFAILLLLFLLWLFSFLDHRQRRTNNVEKLLLPLRQWSETSERQSQEMQCRLEDVGERYVESEQRRTELLRRNVESRAKVALADSVIPFIDRMLNEVRLLSRRKENDSKRRERYEYISELTDEINCRNDVLTHWIQLRQGMLSLRIESFELGPLLAMVEKSRTAFRMKGVTLTVCPTTARVKADRVLTLFMINTLADNARKATKEGGTVTISAHEETDYVEVSVRDTGSGMTAEELSGVFSRNVADGHGFGLMNCRGIIEKYRKTSRLFSICSLSAESEQGRGSRFFFRLPRVVARVFVAFLVTTANINGFAAEGNTAFTSAETTYSSDLNTAAAYADSAYYSNIAGTYQRTIDFADSARLYLNHHYEKTHKGSRILMCREGNTSLTPAEIKWYHDSVATNYNVILDIRNETAVAALALHEWSLYTYNNKVYTQLFKEMSADNRLAEYCRVLQQAQTGKTVAVAICLLVLLTILPAYYVLYYRHRLYYRFCVERIDGINKVLLSDMTPEEKLLSIEPQMDGDFPERLKDVAEQIVATLRLAVERHLLEANRLEQAEDELRRSEYEGNNLYVCNAVLDNCLSTLKHETMYYPDRIRQLAANGEGQMESLQETVAYYRDLCALLGRQSSRQLDSVPIKVATLKASDIVDGAPNDVTVIGNAPLLTYLFDIVRKQTANAPITIESKTGGTAYVIFSVPLPPTADVTNLFAPIRENIPFLICRQIVREHSEATERRACGIIVTNGKLLITLPGKI